MAAQRSPRPINNGVVKLSGGGHPVVHQMQHLSPQRLLEAVDK